MSMEDIASNWFYSLFLVPFGVLWMKHVSHGNRITAVETKQDVYVKKMDEMCKSNDELAKRVNVMIGRMDEHLGKN